MRLKLRKKVEIKKYRYVTCHREKGSDIVLAAFTENLRVDLAIAKELLAQRIEFTENKNHYFAIDVSNIRGLTSEAREYLQDPETGQKNILGSAFIASNPLSSLLANIFVKVTKNVPSKFFSNRKDAFIWLTKLKQQKSKLNS